MRNSRWWCRLLGLWLKTRFGKPRGPSLEAAQSIYFIPASEGNRIHGEPRWTRILHCSSARSSSSTLIATCLPRSQGTSIRFAHALFLPRRARLSEIHGSVGMMTKAAPKSNCLGSINPASCSIIRRLRLPMDDQTRRTILENFAPRSLKTTENLLRKPFSLKHAFAGRWTA